MKYGVAIFPTDYAIRAGRLAIPIRPPFATTREPGWSLARRPTSPNSQLTCGNSRSPAKRRNLPSGKFSRKYS
jgi:hypothetical protein